MLRDQYGRRFITQGSFVAFAKDLGLERPFLEHTLEFAERFGILVPAARVRFPDPIVRRWFQQRYQAESMIEPVEPDGARFDAANALSSLLERDANGWTASPTGGMHPLEAPEANVQQFVTKTFDRDGFRRWSTFVTDASRKNGEPLLLNDGVRTYYHAWQVFRLAAFLRSGMTVLYDISTEHAWDSLMDLRGRDDIDVTVNLDARHELRTLDENSALFDAVAQFTDLSHRALQVHARNLDRRTGRLSRDASRALRARESEIARDVMTATAISPKNLIEFLRVLCGLWTESTRHYPAPVTRAYKQTIASTIELLRLADRRYFPKRIVKEVGIVGGWHRPTLEAVFPNWIDEQREIVEASLKQWIVPHLGAMPREFAFSAADVAPFCDWIERNGFLQFYWHFRRLTDIGRFDDDMARSAVTVEIIGLASLIEHIATSALAERTPQVPARTLKDTLVPKLLALLRPKHAEIAIAFEGAAKLRKTTERTLRQQLHRLRQVRAVGRTRPVLNALLRLALIRNTATHAGLDGFTRDEMQNLIEALLISALVVWMAR